eukprot:5282867-Prymnesium_polylepis.1
MEYMKKGLKGRHDGVKCGTKSLLSSAQERQRGPQLRMSEKNVIYNGLEATGEPLLSVVRWFRLVVRGTGAGMDVAWR